MELRIQTIPLEFQKGMFFMKEAMEPRVHFPCPPNPLASRFFHGPPTVNSQVGSSVLWLSSK